jgi:hypothetical protein
VVVWCSVDASSGGFVRSRTWSLTTVSFRTTRDMFTASQVGVKCFSRVFRETVNLIVCGS